MTPQERQRADALASGNATRLGRAEVRRRLRRMAAPESQRTLAAVLRAPEDCNVGFPDGDRIIPVDCLLGAPILKVLVMCRQMGAFRAGRILDRQRIDGMRPIRDLTPRQREALATELAFSAAQSDVPSEGECEVLPDPAPMATVAPVAEGAEPSFCPRCQVDAVGNGLGECVWCDEPLIVREVAA